MFSCIYLCKKTVLVFWCCLVFSCCICSHISVVLDGGVVTKLVSCEKPNSQLLAIYIFYMYILNVILDFWQFFCLVWCEDFKWLVFNANQFSRISSISYFLPRISSISYFLPRISSISYFLPRILTRINCTSCHIMCVLLWTYGAKIIHELPKGNTWNI